MAKMNFEHDGQKYTVKGEWEGKTFTAQAFIGKTPASDPFTMVKDGKASELAEDEVLENVAMTSAEDDVIAGDGVSEAV